MKSSPRRLRARRSPVAPWKLAALAAATLSVAFAGAVPPIEDEGSVQTAHTNANAAEELAAPAPAADSEADADAAQSATGVEDTDRQEAETSKSRTEEEQGQEPEPDPESPEVPRDDEIAQSGQEGHDGEAAQSGDQSQSAEQPQSGDSPQSDGAEAASAPGARAQDSGVYGCDYATPGTGPYASQLCWIDMDASKKFDKDVRPTGGKFPDGVDPRNPKPSSSTSAIGGWRLLSIQEGEMVLTFNVDFSGGSVNTVGFPTWATGSYLGRAGNYMDVAGKPALYHNAAGASKLTTVALTEVQAWRRVDDVNDLYVELSGGYSVIMSDAESTDNGEYIEFHTEGSPFRVLEGRQTGQGPSPMWGNSCQGAGTHVNGIYPGDVDPDPMPDPLPNPGRAYCDPISGVGGKTGAMMLESGAPGAGGWTITQIMQGGGSQGIAFAVMLRGVDIDSTFVGQSIDTTDRLQNIVIGDDPDTPVKDHKVLAEGDPDAVDTTAHRTDLLAEEKIIYHVGQRFSSAEEAAGPLDYERRWSCGLADGTAVDAVETQFTSKDLVVGADGVPWTDEEKASSVFARVEVGVGQNVSCSTEFVPHQVKVVANTLTYNNAVADGNAIPASSWKIGGVPGGPFALTGSGAAASATVSVPVRPSTYVFGAASDAAKARYYSQKDWAYGATNRATDEYEVSGALKRELTLRDFPIGTARVAQDMTVTSHFEYGTGNLSWDKYAEGGAIDDTVTPARAKDVLPGSAWRLKDAGALIDGVYDDGDRMDSIVRDNDLDDPASTYSCTPRDRTDDAPGELCDADPAPGRFLINEIGFGPYVLYETEAPTGYLLDTAARYVFPKDIEVDKETVHQNVANVELETPDLVIRKEHWAEGTNPTGNGIAGARYELYSDESATQLVLGGLTTADTPGSLGVAVEFPAKDAHGNDLVLNTTYYLKETAAPQGFELLPDVVPFHLTLPKDDTGRPTSGSPHFVMSKADAEAHPLIALDRRAEPVGETADRVLVVGNVKPVTLPVAGGSGIAPVLIVGGLILLVSLGVMAVTGDGPTRRRSRAEEAV